MTAAIVNLRRARKARDRDERAQFAAANRVLHGRSRVERQAGADELSRAHRQLDGHRLTRDDGADA